MVDKRKKETHVSLLCISSKYDSAGLLFSHFLDDEPL